ncbi:MAG TPA: DUF308 domain-containing protein, partial [Candidatus Eremiobacteraceae bacterium]|nr:DUF308 domain-containing protein [Candidatus Eremiobacteraceae bacterium]
NWWVPALRGAIAILFGVLAFVYPQVVATVGVALFAAFALIEGVFALVSAFGMGLPGGQRALLVLAGLLGLAVGIGAVFYPGIAALTFVVFVGWWAVVVGILQLIVSIEYRKAIENDWLFALSAILSLVFGVLLIWQPFAGLQALLWIFGIYAILIGIMLVAVGFRLKSMGTLIA